MASLLRLCTAGSVDDGKSTLIGRLLYDSRGVYEDQVRSVQAASRHRGAGAIDFSLFTDGLRAEREQGITIDVAYRYFATARRRFILADTPGHEQYTRNMATGASTADVAVLLVDARHGLRDQTLRHARIARLLGVSSLVLAVNKMDLVRFDRRVFDDITRAFGSVAGDVDVQAIPISALDGDNVIAASDRTTWYCGPALLEHLETVALPGDDHAAPFRFPVQSVIRVPPDFRALAGQIVSGTIRRGDAIAVLPSGRPAAIARIVTMDGDRAWAKAPQSVALVLDRAIDAGRGDLLAVGTPRLTRHFQADIVWMDERPLDPARPYLLKHTTRVVEARVDRPLALNDIGRVTVTTTEDLVVDAYTTVRPTGAFILIDPVTTFTSGAGMIAARGSES